MAILISAGMVQNNIRITRTIGSSYEVSSQGIVAKLIRASADMYILSKMEETTYDALAIPFECVPDCNTEVNNRLTGTGTPSVYSELVSTTGIFNGMVGSIEEVLSGRGENYQSFRTPTFVQDSLHNSLKSISGPFDFGRTGSDQYYIKINSAKFDSKDFYLEFQNPASGSMINVSIVPYGFNYTTPEPLYSLLDKTQRVFAYFEGLLLIPAPSADDFENELETEFTGAYRDNLKQARFRANIGKRLTVELCKGPCGGGVPSFNVTFQDSLYSNSIPNVLKFDCTCTAVGCDCS
jgi:hypothetical protein